MDSELQRLLDEEVFPYERNPEWERVVNVKVVEAARKVANLDIDKATIVIYQLRYIRDEDEWDNEVGDITKQAVNAALGTTEAP